MNEMNEIVRLAVDAYNGTVEKYSVKQANETIRNALIEANNGSTKLNYRDIRDGKCTGLFSQVEEILANTVVAGLQGDEMFNALVDYRNVAEGDQNLFLVEDNNLFVISETADGTQGVRRQRLSGANEIQINTTFKTVRIYEELNRVLSGRVDFVDMINKVAESFRQKTLADIYALWSGATAEDLGGEAYFPVAGEYSENALLDVIAHVEAAAGGKPATIIGTKKAVRKLGSAVMADSAKEDIYRMGYVGKFYGTPVVVTPQRHKIGSTQFVMDDNVLTVVAGDDKPIKFVWEGDPIMILGDPLQNADLTQEYFYGAKYGVGLVLAGGNAGIGRYETTN